MGEPGNTLEDATSSEDRRVALLIAILALFLALSETSEKKSEHQATAKTIESSDIYNFYQAKKLRQTIDDTAASAFEALAPTISDEKARKGIEKQISVWKTASAHFDQDTQSPQDNLHALRAHAQEASESAKEADLRLAHFELSSGALQIAIVLASASIITEMLALAALSAGLGVVGLVLMTLGGFAPHILTFLG